MLKLRLKSESDVLQNFYTGCPNDDKNLKVFCCMVFTPYVHIMTNFWKLPNALLLCNYLSKFKKYYDMSSISKAGSLPCSLQLRWRITRGPYLILVVYSLLNLPFLCLAGRRITSGFGPPLTGPWANFSLGRRHCKSRVLAESRCLIWSSFLPCSSLANLSERVVYSSSWGNLTSSLKYFWPSHILIYDI